MFAPGGTAVGPLWGGVGARTAGVTVLPPAFRGWRFTGRGVCRFPSSGAHSRSSTVLNCSWSWVSDCSFHGPFAASDGLFSNTDNIADVMNVGHHKVAEDRDVLVNITMIV
jgi:hypothetical protein